MWGCGDASLPFPHMFKWPLSNEMNSVFSFVKHLLVCELCVAAVKCTEWFELNAIETFLTVEFLSVRVELLANESENLVIQIRIGTRIDCEINSVRSALARAFDVRNYWA